MTDAEKLAKFEELRREFRQQYEAFLQELEDFKKRLNLNFESAHKPKGS